MDTREAYQELGVDPNVSDAELKTIWRRLVAAWHPDRNATADASRRMQHINKAYQHIRQLRDGQSDGTNDSGHTQSQAEQPKASAAPEPDGHRRTHVRKVDLSLEEAILGCTRTLSGRIAHTCSACVGQGQRVLAKACLTCRGSGAVRKAALFGWMWNEESCADCGGDGRHRESCGACGSSGEQTLAYRRRVRIPAGVRDGHILSVPALRHGETEIDLELEVMIEPHPLFKLDGDGLLRCEVPVNGFAWMAGRWVEVPTPNGMQQIRLNRNAITYRLSGQGFPTTLRGPRGDYLVKVVPFFPAQEDPEQEALLERLIAKSNESLKGDRSQPLGQWQRRLKRWNAKQKEPAQDA
ncbi:MAG: DnaJ domain-containing protein [Rhodoferax sp.]|nr:DnaJ domain-containing protein [Rhodoferax sp.]MCF8210806.1 DnaJ domain-containing protein [Rhodoferax sp.]